MSVTFEQNIGEQDREGQQKSTFKELDSLNIRENSTRQLFDASNTLDTNVINSQSMSSFHIFLNALLKLMYNAFILPHYFMIDKTIPRIGRKKRYYMMDTGLIKSMKFVE